MDAVSRTPVPVNEPVRQYQPGSHERAVLESKIKELAGQRAELTMTIAGRQQMAAGEVIDVVQPHNKSHVLGQLGNATDVDVAAAIYAAKQVAPAWRATNTVSSLKKSHPSLTRAAVSVDFPEPLMPARSTPRPSLATQPAWRGKRPLRFITSIRGMVKKG